MFKSVMKICGQEPCPNSPCIFYRHTIPGKPPLNLALYVDELLYLSPDESVEHHFETTMQAQLRVDYFGTFEWFLSTYYDWSREHGHLSVHISQEAYYGQLILSHNMVNATPANTPYRYRHTIDDIPKTTFHNLEQDKITPNSQSLVESLHWLAYPTHLDICIATSILAQYSNQPSSSHYNTTLYLLKYLIGTNAHFIIFTHKINTTLVNFIGLVPSPVTALSDANWGPQNA
jgi:hypothetical protein